MLSGKRKMSSVKNVTVSNIAEYMCLRAGIKLIKFIEVAEKIEQGKRYKFPALH